MIIALLKMQYQCLPVFFLFLNILRGNVLNLHHTSFVKIAIVVGEILNLRFAPILISEVICN